MNKKISVIVPAYNVEKYIEECVGSIIDQSYKNIEIIIVDDGSTDKTGTICDKIAKTNDRIKVIHQNNQGLSVARNNGIKAAFGDFISLVDGDDIVEDDFLQSMMSNMRDDIDVAISGYKTVNEAGDILSIAKNVSETVSGEDATIRLLTRQEDLFVIAWNKLYRKRLFIESNIWYPAGRIHEDNLTTYKLLSKAKNVAIIDSTDYLYMKRVGSITSRSKKNLQIKEKINAAKDAVDYLSDNNNLCEAAKYSLFLAQIIELNEAIKGNLANIDILILGILKGNYSRNKYCSIKGKVYIGMLKVFSGRPYIAFRRLIDKVS